jgi:hypothetical protein
MWVSRKRSERTPVRWRSAQRRLRRAVRVGGLCPTGPR